MPGRARIEGGSCHVTYKVSETDEPKLKLVETKDGIELTFSCHDGKSRYVQLKYKSPTYKEVKCWFKLDPGSYVDVEFRKVRPKNLKNRCK